MSTPTTPASDPTLEIISLLIASISLILSVAHWVYEYFKGRERLNIARAEIMSYQDKNDVECVLDLVIFNSSSRPICITAISLLAGRKAYASGMTGTRLISSIPDTETSSLPVNIPSGSSELLRVKIRIPSKTAHKLGVTQIEELPVGTPPEYVKPVPKWAFHVEIRTGSKVHTVQGLADVKLFSDYVSNAWFFSNQ